MQIFCTDGTTVECESFRAVDAGILLFDEEPEDETDHAKAIGFVPITQLKYVLPESARPAQSQGALQTTAPPAGGLSSGGQQTGAGPQRQASARQQPRQTSGAQRTGGSSSRSQMQGSTGPPGRR